MTTRIEIPDTCLPDDFDLLSVSHVNGGRFVPHASGRVLFEVDPQYGTGAIEVRPSDYYGVICTLLPVLGQFVNPRRTPGARLCCIKQGVLPEPWHRAWTRR